MPDSDNISSVIRDRQLAVRRELDRRNIALKVVSFDSGIPYQTILSYFPGEKDKQPAVMPLSAFFRLIDVLPRDLIDLLLPSGKMIITVPEGIDHDELAEKAGEYALTYAHARHRDSECGADLGPGECSDLNGKAVELHVVSG